MAERTISDADDTCKTTLSPNSKRPLSVIERYYQRRYMIDIKGKSCEDQCLLLHSNKICLVTIARSHPIVAERKTVKSINFQVTKTLNRLENKVSGKGKRGAQWLNTMSPLCHVTCDDGSVYTLCSCVNAMLVEINERLQEHPNLIVEKSQAEGYIAIVLPKLASYSKEISKLLDDETYKSKMREREES